MTALRLRWRTLAAIVLAVVWLAGVYRYLRRDASKDPAPVTTYVPAASPPKSPQMPQVLQSVLAAPGVAPAVPAVSPAVPAASAVAPAAPSTEEAGPAAATATPSVHDAVWSAVSAVTKDGSLIFVPYSESDGARGEPNLRFDVWNRRGKLVQQQVVKTVDQCTGSAGQRRRVVDPDALSTHPLGVRCSA